jgi:hypothetical protein
MNTAADFFRIRGIHLAAECLDVEFHALLRGRSLFYQNEI